MNRTPPTAPGRSPRRGREAAEAPRHACPAGAFVRRFARLAGIAAALGCACAGGAASAPPLAPATSVRQQLFERAFGDAVKLDPAVVAKVKAMKPGRRLFLNPNREGKPQECWFIDTSRRPAAKNQPILVRAIDANGIDEVRGPNLSSTLYVVDWQADGSVDGVLEYVDTDHDGDLDQMAFYFYARRHPFFGQDVLRVWWGRDDGDDNLLWYDVDYAYDQTLCQYRCHFSGEETFVAFGLVPDGQEWLSAWENPFLFYDPDGDGCSEVVLRIEGHNDEVRSIRYSFDADDDAFGRRTHDYDFSITAYADPSRLLRLPAAALERTTLRGIPTQSWLRRDAAPKLVTESTAWVRSLLTWDEMNANTQENVDRDPHERWEGVIAHGSPDFKAVGGPSCSVNNKRNELSLQPASPMRLYYDHTDHRIHLVGANQGWLHVDYDFDGKVDADYRWIDANNDGRFDRRTLDVDGDGTVDFDWPMQSGEPREIPLEWKTIKAFYVPMLRDTLADSQAFIDAAKAALGNPAPDAAETYFLTKLESWRPETGLGAYTRKSPAGALYYVGLVRDRLLLALKKRFGAQPGWQKLEQAYAAGDYQEARRRLSGELTATAAVPASSLGDYTRRLAVRIENRGGRRLDWPTTIAVAELQRVAPDFNPDHCTVVAPQRWIDWREIPSQVDTIEPAVGAEISFLADLPDNETATYYVYWTPAGAGTPLPRRTFPPRTMTAADWIPPNIGWENTRTGFRMYWGQFDFFGKKTDTLIYPDIRRQRYHLEADWGMDALHAGNTCGIGGMWLYEGPNATRLYNPAGKGQIDFSKREVVSGPVRAAIEVTGTNLDPQRPDLRLRILAIVYAERMESEIRARVTGSGGAVDLAPGLTKLVRDQAFTDRDGGCLGNWGFQDRAMDEIGMAVIVPAAKIVSFVDEKDERRVRCHTDEGSLRYWIVGDWRRGRQHPVAPTIDNWHRETRDLADQLMRSAPVTLGTPEEVPAAQHGGAR